MTRFSPQETEMILMLCCGGYRSIEIARLLRRTEDAIKQSFRHIYDKAGLSSQTELIAWFYRNSL